MNFKYVFRSFSALIFFISQTCAVKFIPALTLRYDIKQKAKRSSFQGEQVDSIGEEVKQKICNDAARLENNVFPENLKYSDYSLSNENVKIEDVEDSANQYENFSAFSCTGTHENNEFTFLIGQGAYRQTYAVYLYIKAEESTPSQIIPYGIIDYKRKWKWYFSHELKSELDKFMQNSKQHPLFGKKVASFDKREKELVCYEVTATSSEKGPMFPSKSVQVGDFLKLRVQLEDKFFTTKVFSCGESNGITYFFGRGPLANSIAVYTNTSQSNESEVKGILFGIVQYLK